jgi:uncharacterized protein with HEPN domain
MSINVFHGILGVRDSLRHGVMEVDEKVWNSLSEKEKEGVVNMYISMNISRMIKI